MWRIGLFFDCSLRAEYLLNIRLDPSEAILTIGMQHKTELFYYVLKKYVGFLWKTKTAQIKPLKNEWTNKSQVYQDGSMLFTKRN